LAQRLLDGTEEYILAATPLRDAARIAGGFLRPISNLAKGQPYVTAAGTGTAEMIDAIKADPKAKEKDPATIHLKDPETASKRSAVDLASLKVNYHRRSRNRTSGDGHGISKPSPRISSPALTVTGVVRESHRIWRLLWIQGVR
jgi:hypothetical protein